MFQLSHKLIIIFYHLSAKTQISLPIPQKQITAAMAALQSPTP
jgi:hypothetical protein